MKVCRGVTSSEKAQVVCAYKTAWRLLKKLKIDLPYDRAMPGCHPEDSANVPHQCFPQLCFQGLELKLQFARLN